jgi:aminoglycoside 3-N-acetyltransferase
MFSELLRTKKGSIRSNHPIFSISSHGEKSELFVRNNSLNSTGIGTPFERLFHFNAKILHLNLELVTRCTYLHYIEEKCNVPYRYSKYFEYQIIDHNNSKQNLLFENFVRKTESLKFPNYSKKLQNMLILNKITKKKIFKKNLITVTECQKLFNFISNKMKKDKFILFENSF